MKYFLIDEQNKMTIIIAKKQESQDSYEAEFSGVLLMAHTKLDDSVVFLGSEKFFVYIADDEYSIKEISFIKCLEWINRLSEHVHDKHEALKTIFEPNPYGNQ